MKKLILLFSLMAICAFAFADTYIIGTGTSTTYYCPFNGLWDYSWSKAIWTAAELTAAGLPADTPIIGIGFYVGNTPSNYTMLDQRIYVRTTTLTSYSTATDETGTGYPNPAYFLNLFQGDLTYNGSGWHYITFETPVSWDGTSNLELLFENWDGDYVTGYPTFCYTSTSPDYRTVYKSQDNSFPAVAGTRSYNRPNVAIITPSTTPPGAPVLSAPADGATLVSITPTFSWTAPTTGGLPTGYKVYLGESPDLTDADIIADVTGLSYTVPSSNPLQYNHTYYWTVVAYNDNGNGPQADVRSFTTLEEGYITIGTGTSTQRQPFGVYFGYERSAALYTNDQIGGYGLLDEVAWNCATTSTANVPYKIYVMQTNDTALTAMTWDAFTTNATLVAEGTHTFDTTGWHLFELGIPFPYTAGNLIVAVETNYGGSGTSSYPYFYYSTGAAGSHQYWNQDTNPPTGNGYINTNLPNIMLHLGALPEEPVISVSPSSWDFGLTVINTTKTKIFTISNAGAGTLTVNNITIAGDYYTLQINPDNPLPISLDVGQIATFTVQFAPTAVGDFTGAVTIDSNAGTAIVNLTGQCYDPTIYTFPYTQDFEIWPPLGWDLTGGSHSFTQYTDTYGNNWARANFWSQSSGSTDILTSPPLHPTSTPIMNFTWSHLYSSSYPNDALTVQISSDLSTWTDLWYKAGTDLNSNDGAANMAPGTGVIETINIPSSYNNTTFWIRFYAYSGFGPDLFIDNVVISTPSGPPEPVTLTYPANGATDLPQVGFNLTWTPATTGGVADYYAVYMSQEEETIYDDYYWETTNTSFNPVTAPTNPITFNYGERWYWTVEAINDDGNAVVEPPYSFEIVKPIQIFPWTENFDAALTLPAGWTMYDLDGAGTFWQVSSTYSHSSPNSFKHGYSTAVPEGQNGWLITPPVQIPTTGHYVLSWWNYNVYPAWMVYNGLKVNTTDDPNDPNWIELWSPASVASAWSNAVVNITPYAGQTVYFAFNYQGYNADDWYIDDVSIYELIADEFPPIITHLPVLNTPRDDINYLVYAEITDDPNWNNPIGGANLYYSTDSGTTWSEPIAMTPGTAPEYTAYIPAQPLGTTVDYYLEAWDSEMNMATTDTYSFSVNNPTWIRYDTGGTVYLGYSAYIFGPTMLYENPYYGTGIPLKLLETDGESYYATTANLHIYSFDGVTMTDLITPLAVSFPAQTHQIFDLSSYDINITTPYFLISYEDIPAGNYFLWDDTYDYGTTFVRISGQLYTLGDRTGAWCIGAYVTNGISAIETPVVTIYNVAGNPVLSWNAVSGANGYKVYASADPYAPEPWEQIAFITGTTYTYTGTDDKKFFKVTAVTEAPTKGSYYLSGRALNTKEMKPNISSAHTKKVTSVVAPKVKIENQRKK